MRAVTLSQTSKARSTPTRPALGTIVTSLFLVEDDGERLTLALLVDGQR